MRTRIKQLLSLRAAGIGLTPLRNRKPAKWRQAKICGAFTCTDRARLSGLCLFHEREVLELAANSGRI